MLTWVAARRGGEAVRTAAAAAGEEVEERGMAAEHGGRGSRPPGRDQTGGDARARGLLGRRGEASGGRRGMRWWNRGSSWPRVECSVDGCDHARSTRDLCFSFSEKMFFFLTFFLSPRKENNKPFLCPFFCGINGAASQARNYSLSR